MESIKGKIPWHAKIAAKLVLSRLPVNYRFWKRLGLFQHGDMEKPDYAYRIFKRHFGRVDFPRKAGDFVALELGPGDSLFSAMIASRHGASTTHLVSEGDYAERDLTLYRQMDEYLEASVSIDNISRPSFNWSSIGSLEELLTACNACYETDGLSSLRAIPDESVDFIWSHAVFEHIRKEKFLDTMRELRRVLRPDGVCSHIVDLRDHLGGALNNLRFPESLWESNFFANAGFYTNRLRCGELLQFIQRAGFHAEEMETSRWETLPTPRHKLASEFQHWSDEELCISQLSVVLRPHNYRN